MADAKPVLVATGTGLVNIVFCPPAKWVMPIVDSTGRAVLEIFPHPTEMPHPGWSLQHVVPRLGGLLNLSISVPLHESIPSDMLGQSAQPCVQQSVAIHSLIRCHRPG